MYTERCIYNTYAGKMTLTFSLQRKQQHVHVCMYLYLCVSVYVCQWRVHGDSDWQYVQRQFDGCSTSHQQSTQPTSDCHAGQYLLSCQRPLCTHNGPFPSNRHHRSNGDCLEGKRENYQVCSVQYCVQQLCTVNCAHTWTELTVLWIGFCLTGPISLWLDSFLCMYYFVSDCVVL